MPPHQLFDLSKIDLDKILYDQEEIFKYNPQRYEMQQLDGIIWMNADKQQILGYKDITENEFWVRGHIPERPLMPGVIMVEAAAQLSSFFTKKSHEITEFLGFAGISDAKFRGTVVPGDRLYLLGAMKKFKTRKYSFIVQGYVDDKMVFETVVAGMKV